MIMKDPEEKKHFVEILMSFFNYQIDTVRDIAKMDRDFNKMSPETKKYLHFNPEERIDKLKVANTRNYQFLW